MNVFIFAVYLFASIAMAQVPTPKADQYTRFKTAIVNGGFENGPTPGWATSGGAFSVSTTSGNFRSGLRGGVFNSSAASQTLTSSANTLSAGNNQVSCWFKTTATDYKFQAWDGTNVLAEQTIPALSQFTKLVLNVGMSSPAALRARVISASDAADLIVDDCMSGEADNVGTVSQASFVGSAVHPATTNCAWTTTSTSYGNFSVDSDCPTPTIAGSALAPSTKIPGIRFSSLPPGEYLVMAKAAFRDITLDTNGCGFALHDGTTRAGQNQIYAGTNMGSVIGHLSSRFKYTTAQGDTTFQVQAQSDNAANTCALGLADTGSAQVLEFLVYRFPLDSEMAFNPDTIAWRVDANIGGANPSLGLSAVTSYTEITNASLDLVQNQGSVAVQIPCSSTNASSGLTCSSGSESLGVVFNAPRAGAVLACASFTHSVNYDSASDGISSTFQIVETPNNAQTILQEGKTRTTSYLNSSATGALDDQKPFRTCGTFNFSSAGQKTLRLMYEQAVAGTPTVSVLLADREALSGQRDIHWEVYPIDQAIPAPLLVGSVTSAASAPLKIESAIIDNNGTCSVSYESSDWIGTPGHPGLGQCSLPINSGQWSDLSKVVCHCTLLTNAQNGHCNFNQALPFSSPIVTVTVNSAATGVDVPLTLTCMGPK